MKKINSVAVRLALRFSIVLTAAILIMAAAFSICINLIIKKQQSDELKSSNDLIKQTILQQGTEELKASSLALPYYVTYVVYEPIEKVSVSTNDPYLPFLALTGDKAEKYYDEDYFIDGALNLLYITQTIEENEKIFVIETALNMDNDSNSKMLQQLPKVTVITFIPILLLSFLFAILLTKKTMAPVVKITSTAKKISSTSLDTLLPVKHNSEESYDEIDALAATFNDLFKRLKLDFDREKQFTSDVSHELKTPVAVILGQSNLLRRWGKDDPVQLEKSLGTIIAETKSMEAIITNLLQMSRIESGKIQPQREAVALSPMLERVREETLSVNPSVDFKIVINGKESELPSETDTVVIQADGELLHQVLTVITSNSLKFCAAAKVNPVKLLAEVTSDGEKTKISISDNGPGFSEQSISHVFERFYREDAAHTRTAGGSGLGLSIAQTIINAMNGKISAANSQTENYGGARIDITF